MRQEDRAMVSLRDGKGAMPGSAMCGPPKPGAGGVGWQGLAVAVLLVLAAAPANAACNGLPPSGTGTDTPIALAVDQQMNLGRFTRPDIATNVLTITPLGARTLPANLRIPSDNNTAFISAAKLIVSGKPGCWFQVRLPPATIQSGNYVNFTVADGAGGALTPGTGGLYAQLHPTTGVFTLLVGLSLEVPAAGGTLVPGSFMVEVEYKDP